MGIDHIESLVFRDDLIYGGFFVILFLMFLKNLYALFCAFVFLWLPRSSLFMRDFCLMFSTRDLWGIGGLRVFSIIECVFHLGGV